MKTVLIAPAVLILLSACEPRQEPKKDDKPKRAMTHQDSVRHDSLVKKKVVTGVEAVADILETIADALD